jgi:hypothetical protein
MAVFMNAMLNGGKGIFLNKDTLNKMLVPQYPDNFMDMDFKNGLGWFIGKPGLDHAGTVIWHDGGTPHFFSLTVLIPERKTGITLLTNSTTGAIMNHRAAVEILQAVLHEQHGIAVPVDDKKNECPLTDEIRQKATGRFFALTGLISVRPVGKRLVARMPSGTFLLAPCKDWWFSLRLLIGGIVPLKLKALSFIRAGILEHNGEKIFAFEQLGIKAPLGREYRRLRTRDAWKKRAGTYRCANEKKPRLRAFTLKETVDGMMIEILTDKMGRLKMYLDIVNDAEAVTLGYGRYAGETIVATEKGIHLFGLSFERKN